MLHSLRSTRRLSSLNVPKPPPTKLPPTKLPPTFAALASSSSSLSLSGSASSLASLPSLIPSLLPHFEAPQPDPRLVAATLQAFSSSSVPAAPLYAAAASHSGHLVSAASPPTTASLLRAFSSAGFLAPQLFRAASSRAAPLLEHSHPAYAGVLRDFAGLRYRSAPLLSAASAAARGFVGASPPLLASALVSFAHLGATPPLFRLLEKPLLRGGPLHPLLSDGGARASCGALWSLCVLGLAGEKEALLRRLRAGALGRAGGVGPNEARQLLQADMHAEAAGIELPALPAEILERAGEGGGEMRSAQEELCSELLGELGFRHESGLAALGGGGGEGWSTVDMGCAEKKVAVEYDGRFHFLTDVEVRGAKPRVEGGPTAAKRRLLESRGWRVVNVRYFEVDRWNQAAAREASEGGGGMEGGGGGGWRDEYKKFLSKKLKAKGIKIRHRKRTV